eukprot:8804496-Alexandrium_andersonii.AAC.1
MLAADSTPAGAPPSANGTRRRPVARAAPPWPRQVEGPGPRPIGRGSVRPGLQHHASPVSVRGKASLNPTR